MILRAVKLAAGLVVTMSPAQTWADAPVFQEKRGFVMVEAEAFSRQTLTDKRAWHLTTPSARPAPADDAGYAEGASGKAYLHVLPDTRRTHTDKLIKGENFSDEPGALAVLAYNVHFNKPGRYYVWVRAHSTGSEDNSVHVGLDGQWPDSGKRMQWCEGKNAWTWQSKQRTQEHHCGVLGAIFLDIPKPGLHEVLFSMREDGFKFDKFILTTSASFVPASDDGATGPTERRQLR